MTSAAATTRSRSTATSGRSTRSPRTSATCSGAASSPTSASTRRGRADGDGALVGLGRAHHVDRRRRLQPALVPQRHRLAPRQFADRVGPRAVRALAGGAPDRPADARRGRATSTTSCRRSSRACRAPRRRSRSPIRPRRGRRPGRPGHRCSCFSCCSGSSPTAAGTSSRRSRRSCRPGRADRCGCPVSGFRPPVGRVETSRVGAGIRRRASTPVTTCRSPSRPAWFPVPPTGYGGIEWIVWLLADGLVDHGHDVTLFASGDSHTKAKLASVFDARAERADRPLAPGAPAHPRLLRAGRRVRRDQRPLGPARRRARRALCDTPVVHTVHGPLDGEPGDVYQQIAQVAPRSA